MCINNVYRVSVCIYVCVFAAFTTREQAYQMQ